MANFRKLIAARMAPQPVVYSTRAPGSWSVRFVIVSHAVDRLGLAVVSALRQADRKRVTALCTEAFEHLQKQRFGQADHDVPEHLAYDTVIPFRFCAPPPPGLLQYCDITYPVCFNDCVDSHSEVQFSLFAS